MTTEVYIARGRPTKEDVLDRTYQALQAFNDAQGLDFAQTREDMSEFSISVYFVTSQQPQLGVLLNFDLELDFAVYTLACEDNGRLAELHDTLETFIGFETSDGLLREAQERPTPRALVRLGRGFSGLQDTRVMKLLQQGLSADAPSMRRAAALALLSLKWDVILPDLRAAFDRETDPEVRETMAFVQERLAVI